MADIPKTNELSFQQEVLEDPLPVLVDFTAVWCQPCKMLDPVVRSLADEWTGKVKVLTLDVDDNPDLALQFHVMSVPTLMLFKGGEPVERVTGYQPKERIQNKFRPFLS